jgi:hypothetical protein
LASLLAELIADAHNLAALASYGCCRSTTAGSLSLLVLSLATEKLGTYYRSVTKIPLVCILSVKHGGEENDVNVR